MPMPPASFAPAVLFALCPALGAPQSRGADPPLAPDGRPGLGTQRTPREYAELFRSPTDEESAMLVGLAELDVEIGVLQRKAAVAAGERGDFALLDVRDERDLETLHARFRELEADPLAALRAKGPRAAAFARCLLDARFQVRMAIADGLAFELREVEAGLALLRASSDGHVVLKELEARDVARRVDLSAALLRSVALDLGALGAAASSDAPGAPDPSAVRELLVLAAGDDRAALRTALAAHRRRFELTRARIEELLLTPRLHKKLAPELAARAAARDRAEHIARALRPYLPDTDEGRAAPPAIADLARHRRYAYALRLAVEALGHDPFRDDLAYAAAVASDFLHDRIHPLAWYDRFLALRGIRAHDHRTYSRPGQELTPEERHALDWMLAAPHPFR